MYSDNQLRNWERYERIRLSGAFNMFDPRARELTSMSKSEWVFCMDNYAALRDAYADAIAQAHEADQNAH